MKVEKRKKEMKLLKGIDELKYMGLLAAYMYEKTGDKEYRFTLHYIIDEALGRYGFKGLCEVIDFINDERL